LVLKQTLSSKWNNIYFVSQFNTSNHIYYLGIFFFFLGNLRFFFSLLSEVVTSF
jgi:hypothetical protein